MSFHKQQKCYAWLTTVNPTFNKGTLKNVEICGGGWGGGGGYEVEKVRRTVWKNPGYAPAKVRKNNRAELFKAGLR